MNQHSRDEIVISNAPGSSTYLHAKSGQLTFTAASTPDVILIWRLHHLWHAAPFATVRSTVHVQSTYPHSSWPRNRYIRSSDPSTKIGVTREWSLDTHKRSDASILILTLAPPFTLPQQVTRKHPHRTYAEIKIYQQCPPSGRCPLSIIDLTQIPNFLSTPFSHRMSSYLGGIQLVFYQFRVLYSYNLGHPSPSLVNVVLPQLPR
jgi:hypothetical protein